MSPRSQTDHASLIQQALDEGAGARSALAASWRRSITLYGLDPVRAGAVETISEQALQDAIAAAGRAAFMQRLVAGHGFIPHSREEAAKRAKRRIEHGYVNLYPAFRK